MDKLIFLQISNISQQLDKSVSVVNESFHHELVSLETTFIAKVRLVCQVQIQYKINILNNCITSFHIFQLEKKLNSAVVKNNLKRYVDLSSAITLGLLLANK